MPLSEGLVDSCLRWRFDRSLTVEQIYLANHSLGRPPDSVLDSVGVAILQWFDRMDDCWDDDGWMAKLGQFRSLIAGLLGLPRADCVTPKTSAGQGLRAVLNSLPFDRKIKVVTTTGEFDSIDFILRTYVQQGRAEVSWVPPTTREGVVELFEAQAISEAIDQETDLVVVSQVFFTTGQILEGLEDIAAQAHKVGALVLIDAYHALGVIPFDMTKLDADFVIGGCYKYLRGGPGACYLAVHPRVADDPSARTLDTGWFAKENTFGYERPIVPVHAKGGDGWLESTPPVLMAYQAVPGIQFCLEVGVERSRSFSLELQEELRTALIREGSEPFVPRDPTSYGAFCLLPAPDAGALAMDLKHRGITVDARGGFVRFGPDLLNTSKEFQTTARALAQ